MYRKRLNGMNCTIARSLDQVGEWWTLLIVRECMAGKTRFDELQSGLGIARNILTNRLAQLIADEIIESYPVEDRANTNGYRLTKKGEELYPVLVALMQWGNRWLTADGKAPIALVDNETGSPVDAIAVRSKKGRLLSFKDVRYEPGPAATENTRTVITARNQRVLGKSDD
jgi:DNA-binding HxlR family transcriptional regulator